MTLGDRVIRRGPTAAVLLPWRLSKLPLLLLLLAQMINVTCSFEDDLPDFLKHPRQYSAPLAAAAAAAAMPEETTLRPFIDRETPTNVTVIRGKTAMLACVVRNLGTASVSWMRIHDLNVLSLNELTNTKDPRIRSIHVPKSDRWALRIQDAQVGDSGEYECQVTTANKTIEIITLVVLDPITTILGPKEVFLSKGSTLNLTCVVSGGPQSQPFIIWTHNSKMLQYLSISQEAPSLTADAAGLVITQILVAQTAVSHSGRYRCEPAEAPADQVIVHVLDGKLPAAIQRAGETKRLSPSLGILVLLIQLLLQTSCTKGTTTLNEIIS